MPVRPDDAEPQPWHGLYFTAFNALRCDRQFGAFGGESRISYVAISHYAADHHIAGDDFRLFQIFLQAVDDEWLDHLARKANTVSDPS